jgi:AraC-like DNA-binding protein
MSNSINYPNIIITSVEANGLNHPCENVYHKKILNTLSIVQATHGYYEISVDGSTIYKLNENDVFVAPSNVVQEIIHHNGDGGYMTAHWAFIDTIIDQSYKFEELYSLPVVLPNRYNDKVFKLIELVRYSKNTFEVMRGSYDLMEILFFESEKKLSLDTTFLTIQTFVKNNCNKNIKATDIAKKLICSESQVFRYTKKYFNLSPANYINLVRLQQAETLLKTTKNTITEISYMIGFSDNAYFQRLFKKHYGQTPQNYRKYYKIKST